MVKMTYVEASREAVREMKRLMVEARYFSSAAL